MNTGLAQNYSILALKILTFDSHVILYMYLDMCIFLESTGITYRDEEEKMNTFFSFKTFSSKDLAGNQISCSFANS